MSVSAAPIATRIEAALAQTEREHRVRIVVAVESGSRAWGFPSPDSDWDVRFIYARPASAYLSIEQAPETIEAAADPPLDVNGWDIRKALRLISRSNAVALEWLVSPVRYRALGDGPARLLAFARECASLPALAYHYDRLARASLADAGPSAPGKRYLYALRPALALTWLRQRRTPPPMDVPSLLAGIDIPGEVSAALTELIARKAAGAERDPVPRTAALDCFLAAALERPEPRAAPATDAAAVARADRLLADLLADVRASAWPA